MKILLINQFFWPDSAATSQLLTDLAVGLKERGHEVHVICADGGYAIQDESNNPHVDIRRVKSLPFVRGKLGRALSYVSFLLSCGLNGLFATKPDLVITLTTPPLLSLIGTLIKTLRGSRHFIWEMDVYPDVAVDLDYIKAGGVLDRVTGALLDFSRKKADGILALGNCMRRRLMARGIPGATIHVADNWADGASIQPIPRRSKLERVGLDGKGLDGVAADSMTLLYSGNLGLAHDVETMSDAITQMAGDARFQFVFAGGGPLRANFEARCTELKIPTVSFRSYSRREDLGSSLGNCDIGLITQRKSCLGSVVPSKVYGLLAAARPILFIGPAESTVAEIIQRFQCGWQIDNGDSAGLISLLKLLAHQPLLVEAAGKRAREAFERHYDLPLGVDRICSLVETSTNQHAAEAEPASPVRNMSAV